jgi:chromosomal replication initiation ATPase DnaA
MEIETIEKLVTSSTKIDINTKRRQREIVEARALYYKLCKEYTFSTLSQIGKSVGKDHTTVLWGLQNFDNWSSQNVGLRSNYIRLKTKIQTLLDEQDLANEYN